MVNDYTQDEKVEPVVNALSSMGQIWKEMTTKFDEDRICYLCKKKLKAKEKFDMIMLPKHKVDKGLVVYASICKPCNTED